MKYLYWVFLVLFILLILRKYTVKSNNSKHCSDQSSEEHEDQIPSNVHFVLGQGDRKLVKHRFQLASPFSFINYLNFLAARRHLRPKNLYVHYYEEPRTFWWNQTKNDPEIGITLMKSRLVTSIFGKPVDHHAHRGDVMRLEVVMKYGGIYLDIDVLTLRSFQPLLNLSDVVMAKQENDSRKACNAVIIGKKNAKFLKRWYDTFQSFDGTCWGCAAVFIPGDLSLLYPNEITVLPTDTFFSPGPQEWRAFFESNNYDFSSNYASHLWNKMHNHLLNGLTPDTILHGNFTLARMLRHAIGNKTLLKLRRFFNGKVPQ